MNSSWKGSSNISYVSGDIGVSTTGDTLNINSNIIVNVPDFIFSHDNHSTILCFNIKQNQHIFKISTQVNIENDHDKNIDMTFNISDISFPTNDFVQNVPFDIENIEIQIVEKKAPNSAPLYKINSSKKLIFKAATASCVLSGTKVNTSEGWRNIEDLVEGETVLNQHDEPVEIVRKKCWRIKWGSKDFANTVYKIQAGFCGTVETLYISAYHKILITGQLSEAYTLGLPRATKTDICIDDHYLLYNIQLKNHKKNHFSVNGMCLVESWDGSESSTVLTTSDDIYIPAKSVLIYSN